MQEILHSSNYKKWEEEKMTCFTKIYYNGRVHFLYEDENHKYNIIDNFNYIKDIYDNKHNSNDEPYLSVWKRYSKKIEIDTLADLLFDFHLSKRYEITNNKNDYVSFNELADFIREKINNVSDTYIGKLLSSLGLLSINKKINRKIICIRIGIKERND